MLYLITSSQVWPADGTDTELSMVTRRALWAGISTCKCAGPWEAREQENGRSPESSTDCGVEQQVSAAGREAGLAVQLASGSEELGSPEKEGREVRGAWMRP